MEFIAPAATAAGLSPEPALAAGMPPGPSPFGGLPEELDGFACLCGVDGLLAGFAEEHMDAAACAVSGPEGLRKALREALPGAYRRAAAAGKVARAPGCAAFDLGLVDLWFRPVYAVFSPTAGRALCGRAWRLAGLASQAAGEAWPVLARGLRALPGLPDPPARPDSPADPAGYRRGERPAVPCCSLSHVFFGRPERLPLSFLARHLPPELVPGKPRLPPGGGLRRYRKAVELYLRGNAAAREAMAREFDGALDRAALRRADPFWAPVTWRGHRLASVKSLLPLELGEGGPEGLAALVAEKRPFRGRVLGRTVLTLAMARRKLDGASLRESCWLRENGGPGA